LKKAAAQKAVEEIKSGMVVGLGTGSTAKFAIEAIAARIRSGRLKDIVGIPSSIQTEELALAGGIPLTTFEEKQQIDITIDGADEVDTNLNLIKGGGGALLREKVLAQASQTTIIIVDESKLSDSLGMKCAVPVEVIPFASAVEHRFVENLGAKVSLRRTSTGEEYRTDQDNLIIDCNFGIILGPGSLATKLSSRAGIVEHGLFINVASKIIVAGRTGIRTIVRTNQ
jgi:ribose 5-phosphate isomerase A